MKGLEDSPKSKQVGGGNTSMSVLEGQKLTTECYTGVKGCWSRERLVLTRFRMCLWVWGTKEDWKERSLRWGSQGTMRCLANIDHIFVREETQSCKPHFTNRGKYFPEYIYIHSFLLARSLSCSLSPYFPPLPLPNFCFPHLHFFLSLY